MNAFGSESEYIDGLAAYRRGDYTTAFATWAKVAAQGNADAQFGLGGMYDNGQGVLQDYNQALFWYRKAAAQGNVEAQFNLGLSYSKGRGVAQDNNQALLWFGKAAAQGQPEAQFALGVMYEKGEGVARDYDQALLWYRKAAVQGNTMAQLNLATIYYNGRGVTQDYVEALKWSMLAAAYETDEEKRGEAVIRRGIIAKELTETQIAEAQKRVTVDPLFHPIVADVIRRVTEWRKKTRGDFEKLISRPKEIEHDFKPEEVDDLRRNFLRGLAYYGLSIKYAETMGRLSRFFTESVEKENPNLPIVEWWQKLNKLLEIEESFYKQVREAVAANNWVDSRIYSGLAKESLQQIWDSVEEVDAVGKPATVKEDRPHLPKVSWWQKVKSLFSLSSG